MILVDANLLVYAHLASFTQHAATRQWLDRQLAVTPAVGFPWESLSAFLRVVTSPRIFERPVPIAEAWRQVQEWLACEPAWVPQATERHAGILGELLTLPGIRANLVPDAHLAALRSSTG